MTDTASDDEPRPPGSPERLAFVTYLWPEYQYRHDMVWRLAFRVTAVAVALMIAPFLTDDSVQRAVGYGLLGLPLLAIFVITGGLYILQSELRRLGLIRKAYRAAQTPLLRPYVTPRELEEKPLRLDFDWRVRLYLGVLLLAACIYFVVLWVWWLPDLLDDADQAAHG